VSTPDTSKVRLCAETVPSGRKCRQIALKDQPWCHAVVDPVNFRSAGACARSANGILNLQCSQGQLLLQIQCLPMLRGKYERMIV